MGQWWDEYGHPAVQRDEQSNFGSDFDQIKASNFGAEKFKTPVVTGAIIISVAIGVALLDKKMKESGI